MPPFSPIPGYRRIATVTSFAELLATPLAGECNAICWQRDPVGDFDEVVRLLAGNAITTVDDTALAELPASAAGRAAVARLLADLQDLRAHGHAPVLDCIRDYPRDEDAPLPTDVYSFHVDSATVATETFLCSYTGPASEGLRNDEAQRLVDVPAVRARLLAAFGGRDDDAFAEYLRANCFDLHYAPTDTARPFSFGVGNLWRLAVQHPGCPVPACIHRAPATSPGQAPRLLLIS